VRTIGYAALALVAFAANSVLCRLALRHAIIDPATFSTIRLVSGAAMLLVVGRFKPVVARGLSRARWTELELGATAMNGSWTSAGILSLYAVAFSFAYTSLSAGTGALLMFGTVQLTMLLSALVAGDRPHPVQWLGLILALTGLLYLTLPGLEAPSPASAALMAIAGCAWGIYTLRGRGAVHPLAQTTGNFVLTVPFVLVVSLLTISRFRIGVEGAALAATSGAIASGLGYVIWYAALRGLTAMRAAVLQLAVPVLTAAGGVVFLQETISARLVVSAVMILGGIALALVARERMTGASATV
jgi:drug/metabolite transporter (DMT)-like permease